MTAGIAVGGELPRQRRVGDEQRSVFLGLPREAAKAAARIRAARRTLREGIVAAGIEQHDLLRRGPSRGKDLIELDRAERGLVRALDLHVGRRDHVLAVDLHAVAGVVDERHFGVLRLALEGLERIEEVGAIEVVMLGDLEAVIAELRGDRLGIGDGIGEARKMLIFADADDERHALGIGRGRQRGREHEEEGCGKDTKHWILAFPIARSEPSASSLTEART